MSANELSIIAVQVYARQKDKKRTKERKTFRYHNNLSRELPDIITLSQ